MYVLFDGVLPFPDDSTRLWIPEAEDCEMPVGWWFFKSNAAGSMAVRASTSSADSLWRHDEPAEGASGNEVAESSDDEVEWSGEHSRRLKNGLEDGRWSLSSGTRRPARTPGSFPHPLPGDTSRADSHITGKASNENTLLNGPTNPQTHLIDETPLIVGANASISSFRTLANSTVGSQVADDMEAGFETLNNGSL